jgi:hypothetical protein
MISPSDAKWRAVRLRDEESAMYLNRLLREGWHLMRLDADGLPYLGFEIPLEPPRWTTPRTIHQKVDADRMERISVIVLRKGKLPDLQRVVFMRRDETGHFDFGAFGLERSEWGHVAGFSTEDGNRIELFERGGDRWPFRAVKGPPRPE